MKNKFNNFIIFFLAYFFLLSYKLNADIFFHNLTSTFQTINSTSKIYFNNRFTTTLSSNFKNGLQIPAGKTILVNTTLPIAGLLDLSGTLSLGSDLYCDAKLTYSGIGRIAGNGYAIHLGGNFNIPNSHFFHIDTDTIIEGHGNSINLSDNAEILVDDNVTLTLRNVVINNSKNGIGNPAIKLTSHRSKLALDNTVLNMANDFYVDRGQLFIHNDVSFTGTNTLVYRSTVPSFITSKSILNFDLGTTFDFRPSTTGTPELPAKDLFKMQDSTSQLYLNGCTLKTTMTGLRLTKGQLIFDNKVTLTSAIFDYAITETKWTFGNIVYCVSWSTDGKYLAAGGNNGDQSLTIFRIDSSGLIPVATQGYSSYVNYLTWSPDGRYLCVGNVADGTFIYKFDGTTLTLVTSTSDNSNGVDWSPDGRYISFATNNVIIYSFDGSHLVQIDSKPHGSRAYIAKWSPDGKYIIAGGSNDIYDLILYSFNGASLTQLDYKTYSTTVRSISWGPDGKYIAVGDESSFSIYYFNGSTISLVLSQSFATGYIRAMQWSMDGRYLAVGGSSGSDNFTIFLFNGSTLINVHSETWTSMGSASWRADGNWLAIAGNNGSEDISLVEGFSYGMEPQFQAISNSIVFGNSTLGSSYDLNVRGLASTQVEIDGLVNYDNVN